MARISISSTQARFLGRLLEKLVKEGPDTDGYYSVESDEEEPAYLDDLSMDDLIDNVRRATDRL